MAIVGVMGSGKAEWEALSAPLGKWIAGRGFDLLTGAGLGVMLSTARAFSTTPGRKGRSIGIMPSEAHPVRGFAPLAGYPNPFIDLPILTPLPRKQADAPEDALNRNYVNILTSDVVVALPGSQGTLDEIRLATRFAKAPDLHRPGRCLRRRAAGHAHRFGARGRLCVRAGDARLDQS